MITATWETPEGVRLVQEFGLDATAREAIYDLDYAIRDVLCAQYAAGERDDLGSFNRLAARHRRLESERNAIALALNELNAGDEV